MIAVHISLAIVDLEGHPSSLTDISAETGSAFVVKVVPLEVAYPVISSQQPDIVAINAAARTAEAVALCGRIKGNTETCHIPVLIVSSAFHEVSSTIPAYKMGANVCLAAPIDRQVLVAVLQSMAEALLREERRTRAETTAAIGQLTKQMAQGFNGAIMAMLGHLNLVLDSVPQDSGNRARIERALDAASRLAELAQHFLASGGKAGLSVGSVDLSQLVRDVEGVLRSRLPAECPLALDLQEGLPPFIGDARQIQELLAYLVTKAAEEINLTSENSIQIATSALVIDERLASEYVGYERTQPGNYLCLAIRVAGVRHQDPLRRQHLRPVFSTKDPGCGLGLSRVLAILRSHKGGLRIDSGGNGACFAVCFPQADAEELQGVRHARRRFART